MNLSPIISSTLAIASIGLTAIAAASAWQTEPPRIIPHSARVAKPDSEVFNQLKTYCSDPALSRFKLVSADENSDTIVAKQDGIDNDRWHRWAACNADPVHMIYQ